MASASPWKRTVQAPAVSMGKRVHTEPFAQVKLLRCTLHLTSGCCRLSRVPPCHFQLP